MTSRPLTKKQKQILRMALHRGGRTHSGRGGWNTAEMRRLEERGLFRVTKVWTWETDWVLTDAGRQAAQAAHDEWKATLR